MAWNTEETKRRLLAAAVDEFSAHGLSGARVDRIAGAAGVNKERIYAYFGGKDDLFGAVLAHELAAVIDAVPIRGEGPDAIIGYAGRVFDYHQARPQLSRLLAWEGLERGAPVAIEARAAATARKVAQVRHALPQLDDRAAADLLLSIVTLADGWQVFRSVEHLYAGDAAGTPERAARRREVVVASVRAIVESLTSP